ncbi:MAG TPA: serine hydrolase domain-containing protein [Solirubrobacterales bacterium]|nr:serine hydrolase domain-containing protein [Solirubrobacterales bacterium]
MAGGRFRAIAIAATAAVLACLLLAPAAPAKFRGAPNSKLQKALNHIVASNVGPPGISVLIDRGRHTEFLQAGTADAGRYRPPTPFEAFRIASVSKGFNAYLAAKLAGDGALSLDRTLREQLPGILPAGEAVTLRQLLQHTSGLADYIRAPTFVEQLLADPARYFSPLQLTGFVRDEPLEFAPGSRYHYSDTDNIAAGLIEEKASGLSYEQLLQRRVFGPLKMRNSSLPSTIKMPRPFLHGYDVEPEKRPEDVSELINPAGAWASGGIVSTPLDMARFVRRYVPTVLATSTVEGPFYRGSSSPPGPGKNFAGLGIFRYQTGCGTVYGHTGSFPGYRILVAASPNGRRSVVFVANAQIVPGQGSQLIAKEITQAQARAVCRALD